MLKLKQIIEYLFYLIVFLLPWQTRWIFHYEELGEGVSQYLSFSFYGLEILLILFFILIIIYILKNKKWKISQLNYKILNFHIIIGLLFLALIMNLFLAQDSQVALYYLIKMLEGYLLLIFILSFKFSYKKLGWVILLSGLVQSVLAISQFLLQKVYASKWLGMAQQLPETLGSFVIDFEGIRWLRAYGSLPHPNILGGFLIICLFILLVLLILNENKKELVALWISLPILTAGLFFTFSKSAFLAFASAMIFISIFVYISKDSSVKKVFSKYIILFFIVLSLLTIIYPGLVSSRIFADNRLEIKSQTERIEYFDQAKNIISQNFVTGVGLGNYTLAAYNLDKEKLPVWAYQPVHNVFLLALAELGIIGFVMLVFLIFEFIRTIWFFRLYKQIKMLAIINKFSNEVNHLVYKRKFSWFFGYTMILFMLLILMFFDHYLWTQYFGIMLAWICLGLWLKQMSMMK